VLVLFLLAFVPGCKGDGLSDYERMKKKQEGAAAALRKAGAKVTEVRYPQGDAWAIGLSGRTINDELLGRLKELGRIAELDLSKSTVTDDQLAKVNEVEIGSLLVKLDLSHTAVTDAGLDKLTNLLVLGNLNLTGTKATPAGVERFRKRRQEDPKILVKGTNIRRG
jgi:hypothetical protein